MQIESIGQIAIAVSDVEKAKSFYQEVLGLKLLFDAPPSLSFFQCGGTRLMLTTLQGDTADHRTSVIYYKVDQLESVASHLSSLGVAWVQAPNLVAKMPDHELWMGFIRDPDQNLIGLMEERR
ncbi:VOC family protein [Undibacterium cyanobacteriorum]|uniref:VOC family protein n=1 Tax=Undibacterium cyanobacteriorum TaxID=3073561 RepID=A0ABY9RJP7_9BURK|nr:VOC family protein [Undibacterium sp. 20NA77.5]WMW81443.1 VOC family protein [Undibacterium sp. 20NA77.5]